ncbi:hypothetical protein [Saccharothrix xinjiangensis]|uniref:Uncharacterized protein n=1 Tax=Saccharothrix xinjiangensis TaxID=204798 RepID=A0ABV9XP65_9PSEU
MIGLRAEALFLPTTGEYPGSGGDLRDVLGAARSAGVRRVVLLSSQGVGTRRTRSRPFDS